MPSTVAGDLTTVAGDLRSVAGDLTTVAGDLRSVAGDLRSVAGELTLDAHPAVDRRVRVGCSLCQLREVGEEGKQGLRVCSD